MCSLQKKDHSFWHTYVYSFVAKNASGAEERYNSAQLIQKYCALFIKRIHMIQIEVTQLADLYRIRLAYKDTATTATVYARTADDVAKVIQLMKTDNKLELHISRDLEDIYNALRVIGVVA